MNGAAISVKGIGVVSPCGNSRDEILAAARGNAPQPGALSFERFSEIPDARGYRCAFPEAKEYVSPSRLRRFGRIINMSLLAARKALLDAGGGLATPEESSVFYGTGLGSHGDTAVFLENMVKNALLHQMMAPGSGVMHSSSGPGFPTRSQWTKSWGSARATFQCRAKASSPPQRASSRTHARSRSAAGTSSGVWSLQR